MLGAAKTCVEPAAVVALLQRHGLSAEAARDATESFAKVSEAPGSALEVQKLQLGVLSCALRHARSATLSAPVAVSGIAAGKGKGKTKASSASSAVAGKKAKVASGDSDLLMASPLATSTAEQVVAGDPPAFPERPASLRCAASSRASGAKGPRARLPIYTSLHRLSH